MKDLLQPDHPLYLPAGSVRSILALIIVIAFVGWGLIPLEIVTLVLGFYFADRAGS